MLALCSLFPLDAPAQVAANTERGIAIDLDTELAGYGGRAPDAFWRLVYAGFGGGVRVHIRERGRPRGEGFVIAASSSVEHRDYNHASTLSESAYGAESVAVERVVGAFAWRVGYDAQSFGFSVGLLVFQEFRPPYYVCGAPSGATPTCMHPDSPLPDPTSWPELVLRFGSLTGFRAELGLGAWGPSTLLRPGVYAGALYTLPGRWEIGLRGGVDHRFDIDHRFNFEGGLRADLVGALPLHRHVRLLGALGIAERENILRPMGMGSVELSF